MTIYFYYDVISIKCSTSCIKKKIYIIAYYNGKETKIQTKKKNLKFNSNSSRIFLGQPIEEKAHQHSKAADSLLSYFDPPQSV